MYGNLSIDLDNKWAYLRTAKNPLWESCPSYFPTVVPRILETLDKHQIRLTVFVVGRDLIDIASATHVQSLSRAGHELANHSFDHQPWLQRYSIEQLRSEIGETGRLIRELCGESPVGFRGPGYSDSEDVHRVLSEQGYHYCASAFPSSVGPMARMVYHFRSGLRASKTDADNELFGSFYSAFQQNRPYALAKTSHPLWTKPSISRNALASGYYPAETSHSLWMIPVTVQPLTRLPFHFTYLFYLTERSPALARLYFRTSLTLCRMFNVAPSLLLHPLDFLSAQEVPELAFFPGMNIPIQTKLDQLDWFLRFFKTHWEILPMNDFYKTLSKTVARIATAPPVSIS